MFSGIIETVSQINKVITEGTNITLEVSCDFVDEVYVDQSIAHNGVCLTVTKIHPTSYEVVMIKETIDVSCLGNLKPGDYVNIERCMKINDRLDGHMVQGHVDGKATCQAIEEVDGSWYFTFTYIGDDHKGLVVPKGSITVNGTSLTVVNPTTDTFQIAIIPYTYEHTVFQYLAIGDAVNLEFDIVGKYVKAQLELSK